MQPAQASDEQKHAAARAFNEWWRIYTGPFTHESSAKHNFIVGYLTAAKQQPAPAAEQERFICDGCGEYDDDCQCAPLPAQEKPVEASVEALVEQCWDEMELVMSDEKCKACIRRAIESALASASSPSRAA
ncbi:MAG TPA: hypothetical protein VGB61_07895 [Pyrinomonadaceae bacterium]|jgi:hypothetical protein